MDLFIAIELLKRVRKRYDRIGYNYYICCDLVVDARPGAENRVAHEIINNIDIQLKHHVSLTQYVTARHQDLYLSGVKLGVLRKLWLTNMISSLELNSNISYYTLDNLMKAQNGHY